MRRNAVNWRRKAKGSLTLVAILLIGSAAIRIGINAEEAFALEFESRSDEEANGENQRAEHLGEDGLRDLLAALNEREAMLDEKERAMRSRMQALRIVNEQIDDKIAQLVKAEEQLRATVTIAESGAEQDVERLTQVYENMKPKQAAQLFEEMDPHFAAGFLGRMRPDAAAAIMTGLSSEAANLYSVILAGRNASAPRE